MFIPQGSKEILEFLCTNSDVVKSDPQHLTACLSMYCTIIQYIFMSIANEHQRPIVS